MEIQALIMLESSTSVRVSHTVLYNRIDRGIADSQQPLFPVGAADSMLSGAYTDKRTSSVANCAAKTAQRS